MNNEVSITALMSSFGRAFHAENEDHPVFADHLAKELMTAEEYAAVLTGTKQYVMLGADLDTFALREKEFLSKHRVFEVDHPLTQKDKIERITRAGWTIPDNLTFVPADFTKDNVAERLIDGGQSIRCWLHFPNFVRMGVRLCLIIQMRISLMLPKSVCRTQL